MPFIPKFPEACRHLDLDLVRRTLTKHRLDICAAAKELGVKQTDLRRLTWHDPKLLEDAKWACDLYVINCRSLMVEGLFSSNRRKQEWAIGHILSSAMAYGHPLATVSRAPRPKVKSNRPLSPFFVEMNRQRALKKAERDRVIFRDEVEGEVETRFKVELSAAVIDCDGTSIPDLRCGEGRGDDWSPPPVLIEREREPEREPERPSSSLPVWPGPRPPPPLVAHLYAFYSPPPQPMIARGHCEVPRVAVLRRRLRV
jgi:hypothetical protein